MAKKQYYKWDNIRATGATYMLAIGGRNIGKSYSAKRDVIIDAINNGSCFGVIRRWKEDIKSDLVEQYFADMPIEDITAGKYHNIRVWQGKIYLSNFNVETMSWSKEKQLIGYTFSIAEAQRYKSIMFPKINTLIFEEFISDTYYLPDEPDKLDSIVSSVARGREIKVLLVGNTINRFNPYYRHWSLENATTQEAGTIDIYEFKRPDGGIIKVALEMCDNVTDQKMFFGQSTDMIVNGHWQADAHPRLQHEFNEYTTIYEIFLFHQTLKYRMRLFKYDTEQDISYVWFVEPFTKEYKHKKGTRIISDIYNESMLATVGFQPLNDRERAVFSIIDLGKIAFSDNLTGTEFYRLWEELKR